MKGYGFYPFGSGFNGGFLFYSYYYFKVLLKDLTTDTTGIISYIDVNSNQKVTVNADKPIILPDRGLTNIGPITQYLNNPESPITQTTESLNTGKYTIWIQGTGSVNIAGNTATITGSGDATENNSLTFEVTGAGTIDVTITGDVTRFNLTNTFYSTFPIFVDSKTTTQSRSGTIKLVDIVNNFPDLYTTLNGESGNDATGILEFDFIPGFDYQTGDTTKHQILTVNTLQEFVTYDLNGSLFQNDGTLTISLDNVNYVAGTKYKFRLLFGLKADEGNVYKMQLQQYDGSDWVGSTTFDFDGSFNPGSDLIIGYNNIHMFSIDNIQLKKC